MEDIFYIQQCCLLTMKVSYTMQESIHMQIYTVQVKTWGKKSKDFTGAVLWKAFATPLKMEHTITNLLMKVE